MGSLRVTNLLLLVIAVALAAHLVLALRGEPLMAETFRLDACVTERPGDRPAGYVHVVTHGMADVETRADLAR